MAANNDNSAPFPETAVSRDAPTFFAAVLGNATNCLSLLAGPVAAHMGQQSDPHVAARYLEAVARHLVVAPNQEEGRLQNEILNVVGFTASKCSPRSVISQSGILPALARTIVTPDVLSTAHVELLQCALLAGQYRNVASIREWPRPGGGVTILQVLRYYYYRGMIHMGCEDWHLAVRCFSTCVSLPSEVVSAVAICAWKKMVLCRCLLELSQIDTSAQRINQAGSIVKLPSATSTAVVRFFTMAASVPKKTDSDHTVGEEQQPQQPNDTFGIRAYYNLVSSFCTIDRERFIQAMAAPVFGADGNLGMVGRVQAAFEHRQIHQLARIYSVVPVSMLSSELQLSVQQVQGILLQLSSRGMEIDLQEDGMMVSFPQEQASIVQDNNRNLEEIMALTSKIRQLDVAIATTPRFQQLASRREMTVSAAGARGGGPRGVADL